jgi:hypothetical protein
MVERHAGFPVRRQRQACAADHKQFRIGPFEQDIVFRQLRLVPAYVRRDGRPIRRQPGHVCFDAVELSLCQIDDAERENVRRRVFGLEFVD